MLRSIINMRNINIQLTLPPTPPQIFTRAQLVVLNLMLVILTRYYYDHYNIRLVLTLIGVNGNNEPNSCHHLIFSQIRPANCNSIFTTHHLNFFVKTQSLEISSYFCVVVRKQFVVGGC